MSKTMAEPDGKERLNNNEFGELIPHLPLSDLLRVEYRKDKWVKLVSQVDPIKKLYSCSLCAITNSNAKNLNAHMEGKKHKINMKEVKQFFHPEYTYMKHELKLAAGTSSATLKKIVEPERNALKAKSNVALTVASKTVPKAKAVAATATTLSSSETPTKVPTRISQPQALKTVAIIKTPPTPPFSGKVGAATKPTISSAVPKSTKALNSVAAGGKTKVATTLISTPILSTKKGQVIQMAKQKTTAATNASNIDKVSNPVSLKNASATAAVKVQKNIVTASAPTKVFATKNKSNADPKQITVSNSSTVNVNITKKTFSEESSDVKAVGTLKNDAKNVCPTSKNIVTTVNEQNATTATTSDATKPNLKENTTIKTAVANKNILSSTSKANTTINANLKTPLKTFSLKVTNMASSKVKPLLTTDSKDVVNYECDANVIVEKEVTLKQLEKQTNQEQNKNSNTSSSCLIVETCEHEKTTEESSSRDETVAIVNIQNKVSEGLQCEKTTSTVLDENKSQQSKIVRNPFAHANKQDGLKSQTSKIFCVPTALLKDPSFEESNITVLPEVIVIDDDQPAVEECTPMVKEQTPIVAKEAPKPQRTKICQNNVEIKTTIEDSILENVNKRSSESTDTENLHLEEPLTKKKKVVMNPAAVFLDAASNEQSKEKEEETDNSEKPKYETDRIIIPTVHKRKPRSKTATSRQKSQPKFSTKTFSSKPSDNDILGLIGVEYVVKIMKNRGDMSPRYECGLCELVLDGPSMQNHLVGYNHRLKFCEKHFPTAIRQHLQYIAKVPPHEVFKVMTPILVKLAVAIEQHHGRDLPYECLEKDFSVNRHEILSKVFSCRHASEQHGPSFNHVVSSKEIDILIAQKDSFKPQSGQHSQIFNIRPGAIVSSRYSRNIMPITHDKKRQQEKDQQNTRSSYPLSAPSRYIPSDQRNVSSTYVPPLDDETHKQMVAEFLRGNNHSLPIQQSRTHRDREHERRSRRSRSRDRVRQRSRSRSNSLRKRGSRKSISPLREGDIWQAYRHLVDQKMHDLNEVFKLYRNDPEAHPMYNDEWQKFWKRRKDELIAAGLDHRSYNYQPEWVRFFKVRIEELFSQAQENIKIKSRERLCLPMNNISLSNPQYHVHNVYSDTPTMEVEEVADGESAEGSQQPRNPEVVPVLRLLAAFEEHLGSLGTKIIELMSKALLLEKTIPADINRYILTIDNCALLETAMEKLKGVLYAGLLEGTKKRAFNNVIRDTDCLLAFADEERKKGLLNPMPQTLSVVNKPSFRAMVPVPVPAPAPVFPTAILPTANIPDYEHSQRQPISSNGSSGASIGVLLAQMDKKELASKLAATLTAQGKTDFNPEQLEQLIAVYTLIEKKKREAAAAASSTARSELLSQQSSSLSNRKTLSDTLVGFMNPSNPNSNVISSSSASENLPEVSSSKQSYTTATINRYLELMRRTGSSFPNSELGNKSANEIWQNLQNIQLGMGNTNLKRDQNNQSSSERHHLGFGISAVNETYGNISNLDGLMQSQYGINCNVNNAELNMGSTVPQTFGHGSGGHNLNVFAGRMDSNQIGQQQYRQQNAYSGNIFSLNSSSSANASGNMFPNTSNNSRVISNNININTKTSLQRNEIQNLQTQPNRSFQGQDANSGLNWATTGKNNTGTKNRRNRRSGGMGRPGGAGGSGLNQNWQKH